MLRKYERHERILLELRARPTVRISELAEEFGVTTETVRRDVDELSKKGLVDRTYGGAAVTPLGSEPTIDVRASVYREERTRIAKQALSLVKNDEILMIDAGSTTAEFAARLAASILDNSPTEVTVITNSISVARTLGVAKSIRTVLCPGDLENREAAVFGPATLNFLRQFRANTAIIGAGGVTTEGLTEVYSGACWIKRTMLERVDRGILLADHRKFGVNHLEIVCSLDQINDLVTDQEPTHALSAALRRAEVDVHVAG
jgi:DeoR/GlpR family transcriptional regulator of sugar metabolism